MSLIYTNFLTKPPVGIQTLELNNVVTEIKPIDQSVNGLVSILDHDVGIEEISRYLDINPICRLKRVCTQIRAIIESKGFEAVGAKNTLIAFRDAVPHLVDCFLGPRETRDSEKVKQFSRYFPLLARLNTEYALDLSQEPQVLSLPFPDQLNHPFALFHTAANLSPLKSKELEQTPRKIANLILQSKDSSREKFSSLIALAVSLVAMDHKQAFTIIEEALNLPSLDLIWAMDYRENYHLLEKFFNSYSSVDPEQALHLLDRFFVESESGIASFRYEVWVSFFFDFYLLLNLSDAKELAKLGFNLIKSANNFLFENTWEEISNFCHFLDPDDLFSFLQSKITHPLPNRTIMSGNRNFEINKKVLAKNGHFEKILRRLTREQATILITLLLIYVQEDLDLATRLHLFLMLNPQTLSSIPSLIAEKKEFLDLDKHSDLLPWSFETMRGFLSEEQVLAQLARTLARAKKDLEEIGEKEIIFYFHKLEFIASMYFSLKHPIAYNLLDEIFDYFINTDFEEEYEQLMDVDIKLFLTDFGNALPEKALELLAYGPPSLLKEFERLAIWNLPPLTILKLHKKFQVLTAKRPDAELAELVFLLNAARAL